MKTPEQMAEEFSDFFKGERQKTIAKKSWHTGFEEALKQQRIKMAELYSHGSDVQQIAAKYVKQRGTTGPMAAYEENRFIDGYLAAMNSPKKPDGWISVKERLPEKKDIGDIFLVWNAYDRDVSTVRWQHYGFDDVNDQYISHWMPLPAFPEDKGKAHWQELREFWKARNVTIPEWQEDK